MIEEIKLVAQRIRELREISDLSVESAASEFGIDKKLYEEYESGRVDIPVSVLYLIAGKFDVELSALLTGGEPKLNVYSLTRSGKGVGVERRKDYGYQSLAHEFLDKKAEPFLVVVEPKPDSEALHLNAHAGQEFNYILEGRILVEVDGHPVTLNAGDSLYFDSSKPHGMKALDGKRARFIAVILL